MEKICNKCKIKKDVSEFYKRKGRGDGLSGYMYKCKSCNRKTSREYNKKEGSFEKKEYMKEYREKNKEKLKDYINNWRVENIDKFQSGRRDYYQNNKELIKIINYKYCKERTTKDPLYKLSRYIRSLIRVSFRNKFTTKSKKTIEILGCTFEKFKIHLESQFDSNMDWKNQGTYWHMDHIIPISSAKTEEDVYRLNHYTNFQPLYWLDNLKKSNKY